MIDPRVFTLISYMLTWSMACTQILRWVSGSIHIKMFTFEDFFCLYNFPNSLLCTIHSCRQLYLRLFGNFYSAEGGWYHLFVAVGYRHVSVWFSEVICISFKCNSCMFWGAVKRSKKKLFLSHNSDQHAFKQHTASHELSNRTQKYIATDLQDWAPIEHKSKANCNCDIFFSDGWLYHWHVECAAFRTS